MFNSKTIKIFKGLIALETNSSLPHVSKNGIKRGENVKMETKQSLIEGQGGKSEEMAMPQQKKGQRESSVEIC